MTYTIPIDNQKAGERDTRARSVLDKAEKSVGFIPNMYRGMALLPGLLDTYLDGYARFREEAGFSPAEQEVVFLAISRFNGCGYCQAAHSMIADKMSGVPANSLQALRDGRPLPDARLEALRHFTDRMVDSRGNPTDAEVDAFHRAGFEDRHILGIVLAIAVKTLSNYTNHLFKPAIDDRFSGYAV